MKTSYFTREKARNHISSVDIADNIKQKYNMMFNLDYQNTQKSFNLGLDFRILTSTFKDIEVFPLSIPIQIGID